MNKSSITKAQIKKITLFIIPSLIGVFFFLIPISSEGKLVIPISLFSSAMQSYLKPIMGWLLLIIISGGSILSILSSTKLVTLREPFRAVFAISKRWLFTRIAGNVLMALALFKVGPEFLWSEKTGGLLMSELLPVLLSVFLFAGFLLPLLTNFGLLEFCGLFAAKIMQPVFKLPGRSAVDCLASWVGDGSVGILLTSRQYESGYYSKKDACIIATMFSFVSITFAYVILSYAKIESHVGSYFLCIGIIGIMCAWICPRIPPLSRKCAAYPTTTSEIQQHTNSSTLRHAFSQAIAQANTNSSISSFVKHGVLNVLEMWLGVIPIVMAIGCAALIIAEYTPIFSYLGLPFLPLFQWVDLPFAQQASECVLVGFADMFLPVILISDIPSEHTRFVVATLSVTQLIFMSEIGGLLLASKIPLSFLDLVLIFLQRTIIALPIILMAAKIVFS